MPSLNELRKSLAREKARKQLDVDMRDYDREKNKVRRELFNLKHEKSLGRIKAVRTRIGNMASNFQTKRKKGKGIGGFLQRIANNQR